MERLDPSPLRPEVSLWLQQEPLFPWLNYPSRPVTSELGKRLTLSGTSLLSVWAILLLGHTHYMSWGSRYKLRR